MTRPRFLLDTNIVSDLVRSPHEGKAARHIAKIGDHLLATSIIVVAELRFGCAKRRSRKLERQVEAVLKGLHILPLDIPADAAYAAIRAELEAGKPIDAHDLLIAAHARALDMTLVTANTGEFTRIKGLKVENWLA
ncbi:PIN domain-containing protein [Pseudochelatococcus sp. B33]